MLDRRQPHRRRTIHGATLDISTMGGYSVTLAGDYLGYLHASQGDRFNVYRYKRNQIDDFLGKATLDDGVLRILRACGRATADAVA